MADSIHGINVKCVWSFYSAANASLSPLLVLFDEWCAGLASFCWSVENTGSSREKTVPAKIVLAKWKKHPGKITFMCN
jgi:hypothetical protein